MTRDPTVVAALRDDLAWALDHLQGERIDEISLPYLAAAVERSLREGFDFEPDDPSDSLTKLITDGLNVRIGEVITAEVAEDRAANICQALLGIHTVGFLDEKTEPCGVAMAREEWRPSQ